MKLTGGTPNFKTHSKQVYLGRIFYLAVREGVKILIWGYAEGYNPKLGVREYQKVENPWARSFDVQNTMLLVLFHLLDF